MKLLFCKECQDVRKLHKKKTYCECSKSWGHYCNDGLNAFYGGSAILLGINNYDFVRSLKKHEKLSHLNCKIDRRFEAFIIPNNAPTIDKLDGD